MDNICELALQVSKQHPARVIPFDELYENLQNEVRDQFVYCNKMGNLELYKYSRSTIFESHWNLYTMISRGLILCPSRKLVVATPFPKFFNKGELPCDDEHFLSPMSTSEKLDGSLGIHYFFDDSWHVSTAGSLSSDQAIWAEKWMLKNMKVDRMVPGWTYLSEIIYPENKIVIAYDYEGLSLLSIYDDRGFELKPQCIEPIADELKMRHTTIFFFNNLEEVIDKAKTLPGDKEGYVIRFANGLRIKVKGDVYCQYHRLICRVTPLAVWDLMANGEDIEKARRELPEELRKDFNEIHAILSQKLKDLLDMVEVLYRQTSHMKDRDLAMFLMAKPYNDDLAEIAKNFIFNRRHNKLHVEENKICRYNVFRTFKPKSNYLPGYVPSSVMNRFDEADLEG